MAEQTTKINDPKEAAIRNYLAAHVELVQPGLTLVDVEPKLAKSNAFDDVLDIFARDASGIAVIIRIKRRGQTSHEALHELDGYGALLGARGLVQTGEYRIILLSVSPGCVSESDAEFYSHALGAIAVGRIELDDQGKPARVVPMGSRWDV